MYFDLIISLVLLFVGLFFVVSFGVLGLYAVIKEIRGKEGTSYEAKASFSQTDSSCNEQRDDQ